MTLALGKLEEMDGHGWKRRQKHRHGSDNAYNAFREAKPFPVTPLYFCYFPLQIFSPWSCPGVPASSFFSPQLDATSSENSSLTSQSSNTVLLSSECPNQPFLSFITVTQFVPVDLLLPHSARTWLHEDKTISISLYFQRVPSNKYRFFLNGHLPAWINKYLQKTKKAL